MIDIKINITNKIATAIGTPFIVCGNSDYTVTFTFDAEWGAYQDKTARFFFVSDGIEQYIDVLFSGNTCNAPVLPNIEKVLIGVYTGNLRTTTGAEVRCKRSILFGGKVHEPPTTEDVYNEILEFVSKKLGSEGGTVTGDYFKDGNTFIHEGNLDLLDETENLSITATATGFAVTINPANAPLQNLKLFGKTEQLGTPTPDAPIDLVSIGNSGSFEVGVYGKNFCDINTTYQGKSGSANTYDPLTHTITLNADDTGSNTGRYFTPFRNFEIGKNYTVSFDIKGTVGKKVRCGWDRKNIEITLTNQFTRHSVAITTNKTAEPIIFYSVKTAEGGLASGEYMQFANVQIEKGSQATPYEPYNKQTLALTDTLRGIDKFKDEKDFARGVKIQRFATKVFNGSEPIYSFVDGNNGGKIAVYSYYEVGMENVANCGSLNAEKRKDKVVSHFKQGNKACASFKDIVAGEFGFNSDYVADQFITFNIGNIADTQEGFKTWLASNNVTVIYELETPIETPLTETEINDYRQLMTNKGNTTILNSDGADMQVDYYVNKPNAQSIGNLHTQINKDYFKLQQAIIETGGN